MSIFICPVCGKKLGISGKSYICGGGHCFDIAKSGYVNLLTKASSSEVHGDNKLMLRARRDFLEKGYYSPLRDALCRSAAALAGEECVLLDAGCGEGYYTAGLAEVLKNAEIYGVDISKAAAELAAKRRCGAEFAAASVFHLPVGNDSCDMLTTLFAPYAGAEFQRVLRPGGFMLMAIPAENHLWELKMAVYDTPYRNQVSDYALDGFEFIGEEKLEWTMLLSSNEDICSLFAMTPYYYRTGRRELERLGGIAQLEVQADIRLLSYRRR
ncbi:MAG: methyltransferase domain-containing protein [Ruminococcus sp.]|nr:methyltransferase domain-containing protein [Ruminococcus sp.]